MEKLIAFSGGIESTTLAILLGRTHTPIFSDTGWEHKALYKRLEDVEVKLKKLHGDSFKIIRIKPDKTLPELIKSQKFFPSANARYCTRLTKIKSIDNYLKKFNEAELAIGLNYDERNRAGNHGLLKTVKYVYPLIEFKMSRDDCKKLLEYYDLLPNFPPYMQRGGCMGCFFKSKKEFEAMAILNRPEIEQLIELEESIQDKRDKYYRMVPGLPPMREFLKIIESRIPFENSELYPDTEIDSKPCGVFCRR